MKLAPCPFCGGEILQVVKLIGHPSEKSRKQDYSEFEEFEEYVCCADCDDLEDSDSILSDFITEDSEQ